MRGARSVWTGSRRPHLLLLVVRTKWRIRNWHLTIRAATRVPVAVGSSAVAGASAGFGPVPRPLWMTSKSRSKRSTPGRPAGACYTGSVLIARHGRALRRLLERSRHASDPASAPGFSRRRTRNARKPVAGGPPHHLPRPLLLERARNALPGPRGQFREPPLARALAGLRGPRARRRRDGARARPLRPRARAVRFARDAHLAAGP